MIGDAYAHVGDCPGCPHQTCVHTVSTEGGRIVYWNMDCWTCGYTEFEGVVDTLTDEEREELRQDWEEEEDE
tara:strand:- start:452 stop:667 length:216 start_codon:yes stop_codon:yes gene_type:complete